MIAVEYDSGDERTRAVCPELAERWWLWALTGLGVGGLVDWATGAVWRYEDGHWISREVEPRGTPFCYRRTPLAVWIDHALDAHD